MEVDGEYKLYIVTKSEAGAKYFRNTQWCVKDPRFFDQYGAPYYYFTKNNEPYTLLHLGSNQCMDPQDRDMQLNHTQQNMMETEKMTTYVVENDNSPDAMSNYSERVGEGYEGIIDEYVEKQLNELIDQYEFKHLDLNMDSISEGYYNAYISIPYSFKGLEDYFDDRGFRDIVKDKLSDIDLYPDYLDSDNFSEDGVSFNIEYDSQSDYHSKGKIDQLKSFLNELSDIDNDVEKFEESLTEKLLDNGYITSDWGSFKGKVLDNISDDTFEKSARFKQHRAITPFFELKFKHVNNYYKSSIVGYEVNIMPFSKFKPSDAIDKIFDKYFKHVVHPNSQIAIVLTESYIMFKYFPSYDKDMTIKEYMRDFKIFKSLDTHYEEYQKQMDQLGEFIKSNPNLTGNEEIPLFTLRSRKSPPEQGYFQFKEQRITSFDKLYQRILKL